MIGLAMLQGWVDRHKYDPNLSITRGLISAERVDLGRREKHGWSEGWVEDWGYRFTFANGKTYSTLYLEPELRYWLERNPVTLKPAH